MKDYVFSTREIAIVIVGFLWVTLNIYMLSKNGKLINSLKQFRLPLSILFELKFAIPGLLIFAYFIIIIFSFSYIFSDWNITYIKDSILWFTLCGIPSIFKSFDFKENNDIGRIIVKNLTWSAILSFILASVTFSLIIELVIAIFSSIILLTYIISKPEKKLSCFYKISYFASTILFGTTTIFTVYQINNAPSQFYTSDLLLAFFLPLIFSFLFSPLYYLTALVVTFESLFKRISLATKGRCTLFHYLKIIIYSKLSIKEIYNFQNNYLAALWLSQTKYRLNKVLLFYKKKKKFNFSLD